MIAFHITRQHFSPGSMFALQDATAVITCEISGGEPDAVGLDRLQRNLSGNPLLRQGDASHRALPLVVGVNGSVTSGHQPISHAMVALLVALQRQAGLPVGPGQYVASAGPRLILALPWIDQVLLQQLLPLALKQVMVWMSPAGDAAQATGSWLPEIQEWLQRAEGKGLSMLGYRFAEAARARGHAVAFLGHEFLQIGWGQAQQRLECSFTGRTSVTATRMARDKLLTNHLLSQAGLPVPRQAAAKTAENALQLAQAWGWPVVVKPGRLDQGVGVVPNIQSPADLTQAFEAARKLGDGLVLLEQHVQGHDHRLLVVGGRMLMATRRLPGGVTGDGLATVKHLVQTVNADPRRGRHAHSLLMILELDSEAQHCLQVQGLAPDEVPAAGRFVYLRRTANISTGGTAVDVTDLIHSDNVLLAERAARLLGLDIAGVDFLCPDISRSWMEVGGAICEVNAQPGFRPHWLSAPQRDINGEILDWLLAGRMTRIPTVAVVGQAAASAVAQAVHRLWCGTGTVAGLSCSQGVWVGRQLVLRRNAAGFNGAQMLLRDNAVQAAVLEVPRRVALVSGHPCDRYDVVALLNLDDEALAATAAQLPPAVVAEELKALMRASIALVVNADDPACLQALQHAPVARRVLVSQRDDLPALVQHLAVGGEAVYCTPDGIDTVLVVARGSVTAQWRLPIGANRQHAVQTAAVAWAVGLPLATVRDPLPEPVEELR